MSSLSVTAGIFFPCSSHVPVVTTPASFGRDVADPTGGSLGNYARGRCLTKVLPPSSLFPPLPSPPSRRRGHMRDWGVRRYKSIALASDYVPQ